MKKNFKFDCISFISYESKILYIKYPSNFKSSAGTILSTCFKKCKEYIKKKNFSQ